MYSFPLWRLVHLYIQDSGEPKRLAESRETSKMAGRCKSKNKNSHFGLFDSLQSGFSLVFRKYTIGVIGFDISYKE